MCVFAIQGSSSSGGSSRNNYNNMPPSGPMHHSNNWNQNRGNIDMPNLQSLGINPNGQNGPPNQSKSFAAYSFDIAFVNCLYHSFFFVFFSSQHCRHEHESIAHKVRANRNLLAFFI